MAYSNSELYSNPQNYYYDDYGWYDSGGSGGDNGYVTIDRTSTIGTIIEDNDIEDNDIEDNDIEDNDIYNWAYGTLEIKEENGSVVIIDINDIELSNIINKMAEKFEKSKDDYYLELMEKCKEILKFKGMWCPKKGIKNKKISYLEDELFEI
jgi:hypothetical protein